MKDKEARVEIRQVREDMYRELRGLKRRVEDLERDSTVHIGWGEHAKLSIVIPRILRHLGLKLTRTPETIALEPIEGASDESQSDALDA
jgi:hypothetical protein